MAIESDGPLMSTTTDFSPLCSNCNATMKPGALVCDRCFTVNANVGGDIFDPLSKFGKNQPNPSLVRARSRILIAQLRDELGPAIPAETPAPEIRCRIRDVVNADPELLNTHEKGLALHTVLDELYGFGPLGPLLRVPSTQNIYCTGTGPIFAQLVGELRKTALSFENEPHLKSTVARLLTILDLPLDERSPKAEGQFHSGMLLTVLIPPAVKQISLSLRCRQPSPTGPPS
jgi:hypothetical protein